MCEIRVRAIRLISGKLLKTLSLISMIIAHSFFLWISYGLMSPYCGGTDRVVILVLPNIYGNGKEDGEWDIDLYPV